MESSAIRNRESFFKWEWFRRSDWINAPVSSEIVFMSNCVARVIKESEASNCLEYLSGFGEITRELSNLGISVLGYDFSSTAVTGAKLISSSEGSNVAYFLGYESTSIAQALPHKVSAIFSKDILLEPNWHELRKQFAEIFDIINPSGFFVFVGAADHKPFATGLIENHDKSQEESIDWSFRDGRTICTKIFSKSQNEIDFRDYKDLYIINDGYESTLEVVERRIPGYWNSHNIRDLAIEVGFCHFETRCFKEDGKEVILNIAYKDGKLSTGDKTYEEEEAYYDF